MRCVLLQVDEKKKETKAEDKTKETTEFEKTCHASIGTSSWKLDERKDKDTIEKYCETERFVDCPRLSTFIDHAIGTREIKVDTSQ